MKTHSRLRSCFLLILNTLLAGLAPVSLAQQTTVGVQPSAALALAGTDLTFTAGVTSPAPYTCQWQLNGTNLPRATDSALSLGNLQLADAGSYSVVVSNRDGAFTSAPPALLGVVAFPATNPTVPSGSSVTFSVTAAGPGPFSYLWQCNGTNLPNGIITTVAGTSGISPTGVRFDPAGNCFIAELSSARIRRVDVAGIITTVAGRGFPGYSGEGGRATNALLYQPTAVALDAVGNLFIADSGNNRVRKVDVQGTITSVAGTGTGGFYSGGTAGYSGDGGPATNALLNSPRGLACDAAGNLFIADYYNCCVRKVDPKGTITTVAGTGTSGFSGDGGPATSAKLGRPNGLACDAAGNLFIADSFNQRIRKVGTNGLITTVAGSNLTGGFSGDGAAATTARLNNPLDALPDPWGNLFIADTYNQRIRKVDPNGTITTVAGTGSTGYAGDGGPATSAQLASPQAVAVDASGNLFIGETVSPHIRKVSLPVHPVLTLPYLATNNSGNYSVVVTSPYDSLTSAVSVLTVLGWAWAPRITTSPLGADVPPGGSATFSVSATGDPPLGYQWQLNGAPLADATTTALSLSNLQLPDAGYYTVVVTNAVGAATSAPATLSLLLTNADGSLAAPPNLVNWWPAENDARDLLGNNDATAQSGVSYASGQCGQAFAFNGSTNALLAIGAPEIPPPWTACFWVRPGATVGTSSALLGDTSYVLKLDQAPNTGRVGLTWVNMVDVTFNCSVPLNTWTHLAFVATSTNLTLYTNGVWVGALFPSCGLPRAYLGGWITPSGRIADNFSGQLDEVALFNRLLTPEELSALSQAGSAGMWRIPKFQANPVANGGTLTWTLQGLSGRSFTLYGSSNLTTWQTLYTLPNPYGFIQFTDTPAAPQWFYRATQP